MIKKETYWKKAALAQCERIRELEQKVRNLESKIKTMEMEDD